MRLNPFANFGLKLVSVGLAVLIWLTVSGEQIAERSLRVPLEVRNIPAALEVVGEQPSAVDVRVRGHSGILARLQPGEIVATLNLGGARPGRRLFHLVTDDVQAPFGVEVSQVAPQTIALEFERSATKSVGVMPAVEGEPAPGYVVRRIVSDPATVDVVGPESRIRGVTEAITEPVEVNGATAAVRDIVTVGVADGALRLKEPRTARVTVEITPAPIERTIDGVPVRVRNLSPNLTARLTPSVVRLHVRGAAEELRAIQADTVEAFVDLAGLVSGRYNLPVRTAPRSDVGVTRVEPATVTVTIK
jgi:YbbR domain-containing protein